MPKGYNAVTKFAHWAVFLLVAAQYAVGEFMPHIGRTTQNAGLVAVHVTLGAATMLAILVAILIRFIYPVPQLPELPRWQKVLALLTHWGLLLLLLGMTLLGWAATNSRGWPVSLLGLDLPMIAQNGDRWAHEAGDIHILLVNVLLALVALPAGAALYHHFVKRDGVLRRMLPGG